MTDRQTDRQRTDGQTDGQNCDGSDALKAVAAFARKNDLVFKQNYLKYKISKNVDRLPKIEKSITFHSCTVICDVLQPIKLHFLQIQHKLYLIFCVLIFFKVDKFAAFIERLKANSVSASWGFAP